MCIAQNPKVDCKVVWMSGMLSSMFPSLQDTLSLTSTTPTVLQMYSVIIYVFFPPNYPESLAAPRLPRGALPPGAGGGPSGSGDQKGGASLAGWSGHKASLPIPLV